MKKKLHIIITFLFGISVFSQGGLENNELLQNAASSIYNNPSQSIRIAEQIIKTSGNQEDLAKAHFYLSKSYFVSGKFKESIDHFYQSKFIFNELDTLNIDLLIHGIELFDVLNLEHLVEIYEIKISKLPDDKAQNAFFKDWKTAVYSQNTEVLIAIVRDIDNLDFNYKFIYDLKTNIELAKISFSKNQIDSAKIYFNTGLNLLTTINVNRFYEMIFYIEFSKFLFDTKEYQKAILQLLKAEELSKHFNNEYYLFKIYEQLAQNYLALDITLKFQEYYVKANNSLVLLNANKSFGVNSLFNFIQKNHSNKITDLKSNQARNNIQFLIGFLVLALIWLSIKWFSKMKISHYQDIINYLKLISDYDKKDDLSKKTTLKPSSILEETEKNILQRLDKFEKGNKFTSQDMSLAHLAAHFETNTKYLSEVINKHKGKNFNLYINELRIKFIVNKLKNEPNYLDYKVSYLAQESGFSSHSSFTTVFKTITGLSPNVFINLLSKDRVSFKEKIK